MTPFYINIIESALYKAMTERDDFKISDTVMVSAHRSDDDWDQRVVDIRSHCADNATRRWRIRAPMSEHHIYADFEDSKEALFFKLRFG